MKASTLNFIWSIGYYAAGVILWTAFFHDIKTDTWYESAFDAILAVVAVWAGNNKSDLSLKYAEKENESYIIR